MTASNTYASSLKVTRACKGGEIRHYTEISEMKQTNVLFAGYIVVRFINNVNKKIVLIQKDLLLWGLDVL